MQHLPDNELLSYSGTRRFEEALSVLVHRHLDLVYSAALRQVRDPHLARDVAQSVALMDQGRIVEHAPAGEFFENPKSERSKAFLSRVQTGSVNVAA